MRTRALNRLSADERGKAFATLAVLVLVLTLFSVLSFPYASAQDYSVSVSTGSAHYYDSQTIRIFGRISPVPIPSGTETGISVKDPVGETVGVASAPTSPTLGTFYFNFTAGGTPNWINGSYSVTAVWAPNLNGTTYSAATTFYYSTGSPVSSYAVKFRESGLPTGTSWSVTLAGSAKSSTSDQIGFQEENGTYSYTVGQVSGYKAAPSSGSVTVNGGNVLVNTTFTSTSSAELYAVKFSESGLPSGTEWFANVTGSSGLTSLGSSSPTISFSEPNGTFSYDVQTPDRAYSPSPAFGSFTVSGSPVTVSVAFSSVEYAVTFTESGLPVGTEWAVNLSDGQSFASPTPTVSFREFNGTYGFTLTSTNPQYGAPPGSFTVSGTAVDVAVTFSTVEYAVTFNESGLPAGTSWSVTLNGQEENSTSPSISFYELNGVYPYEVTSVSGFLLRSSSGSVTVNGAGVSVQLTFQRLFRVTVTETGLPAGSVWYFNVTNPDGTVQSNNSTTSTLSSQEPNGTYLYSVAVDDKRYSASTPSGELNVSGPTTLRVTFALVAYSVVFTETGLPSNTSWSISLNGSTEPSTADRIAFTEPNGTYQFTVAQASGYRASEYAGSVTVSGASSTTLISWSLVTYSVVISQTGIASGTPWVVTLKGRGFNGQVVNVTETSETTQVHFSEPNGTYSYVVHLPSMYSGTNLTGSFTINGAPSIERVTATGYMIYVIIAIEVIIIVAAIITLILLRSARRKRRGKE